MRVAAKLPQESETPALIADGRRIAHADIANQYRPQREAGSVSRSAGHGKTTRRQGGVASRDNGDTNWSGNLPIKGSKKLT